jgi:hypothetical protein
MTPQEIQERNKQIALMLGWERHNHTSYFTWTKQNSKDHIYESILQFHSDWNWLHEAAEKVYSLTHPSDSIRHDIIHILGRSHKEAVFIAVSDFAKLYNDKQ